MKKSPFLVVLLALSITISCSAGDGWITVKGNKFIDPQGKEIVFRGLCFSDPVKLVNEGQWKEEFFAEAATWGSNIVSFAIPIL